MSRRRILLLGCSAIVTVTALASYLPRALSPIPRHIPEAKACLAPRDDDDDVIKTPDLSTLMTIDLRYLGFNCTRAEAPLLGDGSDVPGMVGGVITEQERLNTALARVTAAGCVRERHTTKVLSSSGCATALVIGGEVPVGVAEDGCPCWGHFHVHINVTPTLCKNGRIHLQLDVSQSDLVRPAGQPDGAAASTNREVRLKRSLVLRDGQTCFIGGHRRKQHLSGEFRLPFFSDLPIVSSSFSFPRESIIDEELLILATVKRVASPQ